MNKNNNDDNNKNYHIIVDPDCFKQFTNLINKFDC